MAIDATVCPIQRPIEDGRQYYAGGKHKKYCQKFEIGVRLKDGRFCWVSDGYPGSYHDLRITKIGGILKILRPKERMIGDKGYTGHDRLIVPKKGRSISEAEKKKGKQINRWRIIVEHSFGHLKNWGCLDQKWRHDIQLQSKVFWICCQMANMAMKKEESSETDESETDETDLTSSESESDEDDN
jgi:hypothetical protein